MLSLRVCRLCLLSFSRHLSNSSLCFSSAEPSLSILTSPSMFFNSEQNATRPWWSSWTFGVKEVNLVIILIINESSVCTCSANLSLLHTAVDVVEIVTCRMTFCSESTCWFSSLILSSLAGWFPWIFLLVLPFSLELLTSGLFWGPGLVGFSCNAKHTGLFFMWAGI